MIRVAMVDDILEIENIYNEILNYEEQTVAYTNWQKWVYPTVEYAKNAIDNSTMFVGENEKGIYGCVVLNRIQPKEYDNIRGLQMQNQAKLWLFTLYVFDLLKVAKVKQE
ncbi:hypothetical protein [Clostridium beijerinckii]|uniref:hypothetical protein n=1 Tax=Clostridium beijerinckii TaxID=1520 RepID=UPI000A8EA7F0|nr:hypothetical protein [Clostridium beijerinckii]